MRVTYGEVKSLKRNASYSSASVSEQIRDGAKTEPKIVADHSLLRRYASRALLRLLRGCGLLKPMDYPRFTLNQWIQQHRERFITFSIEEIAEAALMSGFPQEEIQKSILNQDRRFL